MGAHGFIRPAVAGAAQGLKDELERTQTIPRLVEYAVLPSEARLLRAAGRFTAAAGIGAVRGIRAAHPEPPADQQEEPQ